MSKRKVCANCKFYRDASCSHYWIDRPEQQTCDDFRQNEPNLKMPESQIHWISCRDDMPDVDMDILIYVSGSDSVFAAHTFSHQLGHCYHECGIYDLKRDDYFAYFPKVGG